MKLQKRKNCKKRRRKKKERVWYFAREKDNKKGHKKENENIQYTYMLCIDAYNLYI